MLSVIIKDMVKYQLINKEDVDIYLYGLKSMLFYCMFFIPSLIIAIYNKQIVAYLLTIVLGLGMRRNLGGMHFNKSYYCFIFSFIYVEIPVFICVYNLRFSSAFLSITSLCLLGLLWVGTILMGVVKHKNKIYTDKLEQTAKYKSIILEIIILIIITVAFLVHDKRSLVVIVYVLAAQNISFYMAHIISYIRCK